MILVCLNIIIAFVFGVVIFIIYTASVVSELLVFFMVTASVVLGFKLGMSFSSCSYIHNYLIKLCFSGRLYSTPLDHIHITHYLVTYMTCFSNYTLSNFL